MVVSEFPISIGLVIALLLAYSAAAVADASPISPYRLEIFTTSDQPATNLQAVSALHKETEIRVYWLDGIHQFEAELSQGLPADPRTAEGVVLERLQQLEQDRRDRVQESGEALVRTVQHGIEKYPAIVFDEEVVVYGLTDVSMALLHYDRWRAGHRQ